MPTARIVLSAVLLAIAAPAVASADRLVTPSAPPVTFQSTGLEMVAFGGYVYFAANDGVHGNELWRTDGTPAGTTLVMDFNSSSPSASGNPRQLTVVGTRMFLIASPTPGSFVAFTIDAGDGTPHATSVAPGGEPGTESTGGTLMGSVNGIGLLFHYDGVGGSNKLYGLGSSGSVFSPITVGSLNVDANAGTATVGGFAYYGQTDGNNSASEPWRTNGSTTTRVKDIVAGIGGSAPSDWIATGNLAYFTADDGTHGRELWVTDGTEGGTQIVHDHHPLSAATSITQWTASGNVLYYVPNDPTTGQEVWRTEGTDATTRVVKDITPGVGGSGQIKLFPFKDGFGMLRGSDIYVSDGTDAGTTLLGAVDGDGLGPAYPTVVGSRFYFRGGLSPYGSAIWRSDGTPAGTRGLTAGAFDGAASGNPDAGPPVQLGDKVIFTAQYPHAAGDPVPASARRIYVIDTSQADATRGGTAAPPVSGTPAVVQKLSVSRKAKLTGAARVGQRIKLKLPKFAQPGVKLSFRWYANGKRIKKQTTSSLKLTKAFKGKRITAKITVTKAGYTTLTLTVGPTAKVKSAKR